MSSKKMTIKTFQISQLTLTQVSTISEKHIASFSRLEQHSRTEFSTWCNEITQCISVYQYQNDYYPIAHIALLTYLNNRDPKLNVKVLAVRKFRQLTELKKELSKALLYDEIGRLPTSQLSAYQCLLSEALQVKKILSQRQLAKIIGLEHSTLSKASKKLRKLNQTDSDVTLPHFSTALHTSSVDDALDW